MALIDKASLLMVPSTYEAGKLYNVLPSGNRAPDSTDQNSGYDQTRADFDFDRGSNAAATRIGSDGLIEKYRENKLLQSNAFDTTWVPQSGITLTANQQGYDGTNDAWKFEKTASSYRNIRISVSVSGVYTTSVYAKAGTLDLLTIRDGSNQYARFYLSTGTYTLSNSPVSGSMVSVGNGWYRCSVTMTTSNPTIQIYPDWNQTNAGYIYIQNAQLESGLVSTDYLESTSVTGKAGVLVDLPRINYDANGENGALLLEPSRQQLIQYSEYFGDSSWIKSSSVVVTSNASTSPEGVENAGLVEFPASTNRSLVYVVSGISSNTDYTFSLYIKKVSGTPSDTDLKMTIYGDVVSSVTNNIGSDISGEWQRFDVTATTNGSASSLTIQLRSEVLQSMYIFAAQLEAGSYATSYIPNHGESGGVTRAADSCSVTGASDVIGQTEGTIFVDLAGFDGNTHLVTLGDGTALNYLMLYISSGAIAWLSNGGLNGSAGSVTATSKAALAYKGNDSALYLDGVQVLTNTSSTIPSLPNVYLNNNATLTNVLKLETKQVTLFNERLSNAELAALTA